ncbi:MAG TPA: hypothetical protein VNA89_01010 [Gemmatimonadaceae bacterium]|nr:hypothetical protein [Gemmatimonadaceae bacterium]
MKGLAAFAGLSLLLTAAAFALLTLGYESDADRRALAVSAGVAYVVQLFTFAVVRLLARTNVIAGWGLGAALRLVTLAVYALVIVQAFALPISAALVSLAVFLFLSTLIEPLLLTL